MPGTVVVEVQGAGMIARELVSAGDRAANVDPAFWQGMSARLERIEREQYETRGARGPNGPWPDNTAEWQWFKFQNSMSLELMKATEATFEALTGETADSVRLYSSDTLTFGANTPQFAIWQSRRQYDGPDRLPIDLTEQDEREIGFALLDYILNRGTLDKSGRKRHPRGAKDAKGRSIGGRFA